MQREQRYLVVKYKDMAAYLSDEDAVALIELVKKVDAGRRAEGKQAVECVCVESDWPEYEEVWAMITARVDDVWLHKARMQQYKDYDPDLKVANDRVEGRDAALSRRVPSHDGLEGYRNERI